MQVSMGMWGEKSRKSSFPLLLLYSHPSKTRQSTEKLLFLLFFPSFSSKAQVTHHLCRGRNPRQKLLWSVG